MEYSDGSYTHHRTPFLWPNSPRMRGVLHQQDRTHVRHMSPGRADCGTQSVVPLKSCNYHRLCPWRKGCFLAGNLTAHRLTV
jgi:hypothetical protein